MFPESWHPHPSQIPSVDDHIRIVATGRNAERHLRPGDTHVVEDVYISRDRDGTAYPVVAIYGYPPLLAIMGDRWEVMSSVSDAATPKAVPRMSDPRPICSGRGSSIASPEHEGNPR